MIKSESLEKLFGMIQAGGKLIFGPKQTGDKVNYEIVGSYSEIAKDFIQTTMSAKSVVFPRVEKLFSYKKDKDNIQVTDFDPSEIPDVVIWGIHPCDAQGFIPLTSIFTWDIKDPIYLARLQKTTVIGFSCHEADEYCFCTSVGGGPGQTEGSDILLTRLSTGDYLAEIITEKGKAILDLASSLFEPELHENKDNNLADVAVRFTREEIRKNLQGFFESDVWEEQSMRCLGCGSCAFVCPVCACFDIQDEKHGNNGVRYRCWDSCGNSLFTLHTSGHNPREHQHQRWRQRLLHKFLYMPERLSVYGCTGCGRCSRACPVDMNIVEHLVSLNGIKK